jgi:hypothetical protein
MCPHELGDMSPWFKASGGTKFPEVSYWILRPDQRKKPKETVEASKINVVKELGASIESTNICIPCKTDAMSSGELAT